MADFGGWKVVLFGWHGVIAAGEVAMFGRETCREHLHRDGMPDAQKIKRYQERAVETVKARW